MLITGLIELDLGLIIDPMGKWYLFLPVRGILVGTDVVGKHPSSHQQQAGLIRANRIIPIPLSCLGSWKIL